MPSLCNFPHTQCKSATKCPISNECPDGEFCYRDFTCDPPTTTSPTKTATSNPTPRSAPPTKLPTAKPTPLLSRPPTKTPVINTNFCGTTWEDRTKNCGSSRPCPRGDKCGRLRVALAIVPAWCWLTRRWELAVVRMMMQNPMWEVFVEFVGMPC